MPPAAAPGWEVGPLSSNATGHDDKHFAWRFSVGYQFNAYWAIEAGYADLGEVHATGAGQYSYSCSNQPGQVCLQLVGIGPYTSSSKLRVNGLGVDVIGEWPLSPQWALFARLGAFDAHTRFEQTSTPDTGAVEAVPWSTRSSGNGWDPEYGVGVALTPGDRVAWRLGWSRFVHVGDRSTGGSVDLDYWSLGFACHL